MSRYQKYQAYKDSGVEWIGEIPEHWKVKQARHVFRIFSGSTPKSGEELFWDGDITWFTPEDLGNNQQKNISESRRKITEDGYKSCGTSLAKANSIVLSTRAPIGHIALSTVPACCNQGCRILEQEKGIPEFWYYTLLSAKPILQSLGQGSTFMELPRQSLASFKLPCPPHEEQQVITSFLDRKTAQIDELIAKKEALLKKLDEKRTTIITQAVTKGLDPSVPMKDSGVEWIGKIPEHWKCIKLKYLSQVQRGASPRPIDDPIYFDDEGEYSWVRISDVTASNKYLEYTEQRLSDIGKTLSVILHPGQLFLSIAGSVGKPIITKINCCIHDGFVYFPFLKGCTDFLYYIFASGQPYLGLGKMGTQLNLNTDTVGSIYVPLPPLEEQLAISNYIKKFTAKTDRQNAQITEAIERLKEYRIATINNAVSGKSLM